MMVELSSDRIKELRGEAQQLDAKLQVGKSGISDAFVEELLSMLKRDRLVKVRLLRSARTGSDRDEMAEQLADAADAVLVETRGNTVVLYRPRGGQ